MSLTKIINGDPVPIPPPNRDPLLTKYHRDLTDYLRRLFGRVAGAVDQLPTEDTNSVVWSPTDTWYWEHSIVTPNTHINGHFTIPQVGYGTGYVKCRYSGVLKGIRVTHSVGLLYGYTTTLVFSVAKSTGALSGAPVTDSCGMYAGAGTYIDAINTTDGTATVSQGDLLVVTVAGDAIGYIQGHAVVTLDIQKELVE